MNNEDEVKLYYVTPAYDPAVRVLLYATNDAEAYGRVSVEGEVAVDGGPYALTSNPTNARMDGENLSVGFLSQADADRWAQQNQPNNKYSTTELTKLTEACGGYEDIDVCAELTREAEKLGMYETSESRRQNGFIKDDRLKPCYTLVEPSILYAIEAVGAVGRKKYSRDGIDGKDNWKLAFDPDPTYGISVYFEAFLRHVIAHWGGGVMDDGDGGTGLPHLYCAAWNLNAVLYGQGLLAGKEPA